MPFDKSLYPPHWDLISARIKARAQDQCEWIEHGVRCGAVHLAPHPVTGSRVVLTTAHLEDETPWNCTYENLASLCQMHHLAYDAKRRKEKRQKEEEADRTWEMTQGYRDAAKDLSRRRKAI